MNYHRLIRIISVFSLIIAIANILLFAFHIINAAVLWIVIIILALIAWPGINYLRKRAGPETPKRQVVKPTKSKLRKK